MHEYECNPANSLDKFLDHWRLHLGTLCPNCCIEDPQGVADSSTPFCVRCGHMLLVVEIVRSLDNFPEVTLTKASNIQASTVQAAPSPITSIPDLEEQYRCQSCRAEDQWYNYCSQCGDPTPNFSEP